MTHAAQTFTGKTIVAGPAPTAPAASAPDDGRLKLQAFAASHARSSTAPRTNWELRSLGALGFELASARG